LRPGHGYAKSKAMPTDPTQPEHSAAADGPSEKRPLSPAAERALAEAALRRAERDKRTADDAAKEVDGRGGLDPTRYGDWEVNGLTSDF